MKRLARVLWAARPSPFGWAVYIIVTIAYIEAEALTPNAPGWLWPTVFVVVVVLLSCVPEMDNKEMRERRSKKV